MDASLNEGLELLELRIFKAIDRPDEALNFAFGQKQQLKTRNISGVKSAKSNWTTNPSVHLMALYAGEKIVGGTRLHLNNNDYLYPFLEAAMHCDDTLMQVMKRPRNPHHAEGCGLWLAQRYSGFGLGEFLTRALITTAHRLGLDHIYGICPRHTMDPFRKIGFHFLTLDDNVIAIPYPKDYTSYLIQCEVSELRYTFQSERSIIRGWLSDQFQNVISKGKMGEIVVKLTGFPEPVDLPSELDEEFSRFKAWIQQKQFVDGSEKVRTQAI